MSLDQTPTGAESDVLAAAEHAVSRALMAAALEIASAAGAETPALTVPRSTDALAPARLASSTPGGVAARRDARLLYERCLRHYREHLQADEGPHDDVGAAAARFVAANFQALHGTVAATGTLLAVERQLCGLIRNGATWDRATAVERQVFFESMALLAVLIGESARQALRQGAAARANLRRAARDYLKQLLGLDPDALMLGPDGLTLRDTD